MGPMGRSSFSVTHLTNTSPGPRLHNNSSMPVTQQNHLISNRGPRPLDQVTCYKVIQMLCRGLLKPNELFWASCKCFESKLRWGNCFVWKNKFLLLPPRPPLCVQCGEKGHYANKCNKGHLAFLSGQWPSSWCHETTGKMDILWADRSNETPRTTCDYFFFSLLVNQILNRHQEIYIASICILAFYTVWRKKKKIKMFVLYLSGVLADKGTP